MKNYPKTKPDSLKRCPWCRHEPIIGKSFTKKRKPWSCYCWNMNCTVRPSTIDCKTKEECIEKWNSYE